MKQRIREITGIDGVDAVIECVGKPIAAKQAIEAAGFGANVLLFSVLVPGSSIELCSLLILAGNIAFLLINGIIDSIRLTYFYTCIFMPRYWYGLS